MMKIPPRPAPVATYTYETQPLSIGWMIAIVLIIALILIGCWALVLEANKAQAEDFAIKQACVSNGFPEVIEINGTIFCHRLNNGTDEIIPLDWANFEGGE